MSEKTEDNINVYLKIIEYKRSIGITQWTVLSLFITVSEAVFVFSFSQSDPADSLAIRLFGMLIYWLGFFMYNRYRGLNNQVSRYLVELEKENHFGFQKYLNEQFHSKGLSTRQILIIAGCTYFLITIVISLI